MAVLRPWVGALIKDIKQPILLPQAKRRRYDYPFI
jgi:hypothetical protein